MGSTTPHWRSIIVDGICYAGGYCWCDDPDAETHRIGLRPPEPPASAPPSPERVSLLNGPYAGANPRLSKQPPRIEIGGVEYVRIDDPDTGESLGAYAYIE